MRAEGGDDASPDVEGEQAGELTTAHDSAEAERAVAQGVVGDRRSFDRRRPAESREDAPGRPVVERDAVGVVVGWRKESTERDAALATAVPGHSEPARHAGRGDPEEFAPDAAVPFPSVGVADTSLIGNATVEDHALPRRVIHHAMVVPARRTTSAALVPRRAV